ncbi:hypothetical protein A2Z22_03815 [Candidatus Woesebacteria bacterium RBG_16_34_12]|uniref:Uncharacterized protein n=1 Tax=Candidatus Woesebacteria bacterium RBG_16_34_12 TaxID=1802480 RepID=A0A1F7X7E1_9BACT|nr:MAG: hypothetical protein A2Z22_03815 [Candidatus Woesebacteria bacterium RBG_16_34_12]
MTLTIKDLDEIERIVDERIEERTRNLPSKDDFFTRMDEVMKELKAIRENTIVLSHRVFNHADRIEKIEKKIKSALST